MSNNTTIKYCKKCVIPETRPHTEIDEESHGPLAVRMLSCLCDGDSQRLEESIEAAQISLQARIVFWDGVHNAISKI